MEKTSLTPWGIGIILFCVAYVFFFIGIAYQLWLDQKRDFRQQPLWGVGGWGVDKIDLDMLGKFLYF